ncbi:precorrin-2 dehydrogenase / sirohydrochlorin ferrochelatase [Paenibacillus sp. UNCCL117]|uniref:precorrin-2 dehydrogenase/sirohydrochlorin ferrochelatase family protein n=1 Tax=unclassified Paenibacillus TaxID=185978 RepID=UPI00088A73BE|nr:MULTISPECIES: bifunctional precorrin-2 dehydrogenase/sirohydrochlorin ferrochelatase [unclassified Paenibacillus]SDD25298.1 precorrin-2 dehydrogenase / sirohydrochlorin ferrochelatase [Paenibacillus sp. cl123]SFW41295.1 precorrin-2 dehydrogenase / sirohydrochlorin ferrochelatase [Paenibacillus sp. UNCCL117]
MTRWYPVMLQLEGKRCCVIGGGRVAQRKVQGLLDAGAEVTVISPRTTAALGTWAAQGLLRLVRRHYEQGMQEVQEAALLFAATDDEGVNASVREEGAALGIWVNAADTREHGDLLLPAVLRQGGLTVAVSTSGASPGLAQLVRDEIGEWLGSGYETYLDLLLELRLTVQQLVADTGQRQTLFRMMLDWDLQRRMRAEGGLPQPLREELLDRVRRDPSPEGIRRIGIWLAENDYT